MVREIKNGNHIQKNDFASRVEIIQACWQYPNWIKLIVIDLIKDLRLWQVVKAYLKIL